MCVCVALEGGWLHHVHGQVDEGDVCVHVDVYISSDMSEQVGGCCVCVGGCQIVALACFNIGCV